MFSDNHIIEVFILSIDLILQQLIETRDSEHSHEKYANNMLTQAMINS